MPLYNLRKQNGVGGVLCHVETSSKNSKIVAIGCSHQWALGKDLSHFSEWCARKGMVLDRITDKAKMAQALASLRPQGELSLT